MTTDMTTKPRPSAVTTVSPLATAPSSPPQALLQEAPLRELIAARAVGPITAVGGDGGFVVRVSFGAQGEDAATAVLASARGHARIFASLSAVASLLQRLGRPQFEVDATEYRPGRVRAAQPERSAAMKSGRLPKAAAKTPTKSKTKSN